MEKNVISSCSDSEEMEMQRLQKKASIMKDSFLNGLSALKSKFTLLSKKDVLGINASEFECAFSHIFGEDVHTFTRTFSQNMATLETQLTSETLHESNCKTAFIVLKTPFEKIFTSVLIKSSHLDGTYSRKDFKAYTGMKPQDFKERILKDFDFIQKYMIKSILNDKEIEQRLNAKRLQKQGEVDMDNALDASLVFTKSSRIDSRKKNDCSKIRNDQRSRNESIRSGNESSRSRNECSERRNFRNDTDIRPSYDTKSMAEVPNNVDYNVFVVETQHSEQPKNMNDTSLMEKVDSNTTPDSFDMCNNEFKDDENDDHEDERVVLANLIANLKLDINENKKIQKQLRNANTTLTYELKECKSTLEETNRTLGESNRTRDRYLGALHDIDVELAKYKTYHDRTIENDTLERKLKETLGLSAQKEHDIKEGLKLKAYEIFVVKEKNDELVKHSLLTNSRYEGLVKEKNKVIKDLKLKEERDLEKLIAVEKQLTFLNEIVYKRNQSIQTIHMLAPKSSKYNGRPTFANPMYLKKAQSEKSCLYEILYDKDDLANIFSPDREEILSLEQESRSKLNKDEVKPYDYIKQNSLYEIFKPPSKEYLDQLDHAK
ncbi:hypothetical protein Tco_0789141 [Tanacetum coccineum]